ncbi:unnamed protein product [Owenia fusiformis]|uniref:Sugar transporter SWEET1 n=1 Tax=Owenia fusiformis TaxID=6347 RepID=A0A8J1TYS3_OWEFU|nr:unnamed protein product [Owenia fusiformis]
MDVLTFVEYFTNLATLGMFATGIPGCYRMYKTGDTENNPFIFFLLSAVSCIKMWHYGLLVDNGTLIFLNAVGTVLQIIYVIVSLLVTKPLTEPLALTGASLGYLMVLYYYQFNVVVEPNQIAENIGLAGSVLTTIMMVLPVFEIVDNVKNRNGNGLPLIMVSGAIVCSISWLVFGLLLADPFVWGPNLPGLVLMTIKLICILSFGQDKTKKVD